MGWCKYQSWTLYIINSYKFQVIYSYVEGYVGRLAGSLVGNRRIGRSEKRETCKSESTVPPLVHIETVSFNPNPPITYFLTDIWIEWGILYIYPNSFCINLEVWKVHKLPPLVCTTLKPLLSKLPWPSALEEAHHQKRIRQEATPGERTWLCSELMVKKHENDSVKELLTLIDCSILSLLS